MRNAANGERVICGHEKKTMQAISKHGRYETMSHRPMNTRLEDETYVANGSASHTVALLPQRMI